MAKQNLDIPGNAMASQLAFQKIILAHGTALARIDHLVAKGLAGDIHITTIRLRAPSVEGGEWLAVVKATTENGNIVGFHGGTGLGDLVSGLANRLNNGSIKWKEDEYA